MGKSSYQKGYSFERRVKELLEEQGYLAIRTPSSKGPFDIIAAKNSNVLLIQCKVKKKYMGKAAWRKLDLPAEISGGVPLLSYRLDASQNWKVIFELESGDQYDV